MSLWSPPWSCPGQTRKAGRSSWFGQSAKTGLRPVRPWLSAGATVVIGHRREKSGFRLRSSKMPSDDDDVYYYIRWRLKLEGETENMSVCTKERKGVTAAVLMATPCTNSLGGENGEQKHEGCGGRSACWRSACWKFAAVPRVLFLFFFFLSDREPHCHLDAEGGEGWETGRLWEVAAERASVCMRRRMM